MYPIELIPDQDKLFYRVHRNYIRENELIPGCFKEQGQGTSKSMSTDWAKYSTANETRRRAIISSPKDNYVVSFITGQVRSVPFTVNHSPGIKHQAHTDIKGIFDEETRLKLKDIYTKEIFPKTE